MMRKLFAAFSLSFLFLFLGCVSRPQLTPEDETLLYPLTSYVPEVFDWQEIRDEAGVVVPGVWRFDFENPDFPLVYHAVKIELSSPVDGAVYLKLLTSQWERTSDFAARENCLVAVNATPFDKTKLAGICKTGGELLSEPVERYAALGFQCSEDGLVTGARVFESQMDGELALCEAAFGGFFVVLKDGQVRTDFVRRGDSRCGAGVSADGKTLYFLLVEGERPQKSRGLSYPQCGEIFLAMGCCDALEFDGGGSAELCIKGRSVLGYRVRRVQGNSFGFISMSSSGLNR